MSQPRLWSALIRTHHITSRKKVAKLRAAASNYDVYAVLRSGGCPGIMYCEGMEDGVKSWVASVQRLRYKDFQLAMKPGMKDHDEDTYEPVRKRKSAGSEDIDVKAKPGSLEEVGSVKEFGSRMEKLGVWAWWRKGMGYVHDD